MRDYKNDIHVKISRELETRELPQWCAIAATCPAIRPSRPRTCARLRVVKGGAPGFEQRDPLHPSPTPVHL